MTYVADTHPLIWFLNNNPQLGTAALSAFEDASATIVIPSIVLAEIKHLFDRGRIGVDLPRVLAHARATVNCLISALDEQVAALLPAGLDIHDGIIVATAMMHRDHLGQPVSLITRDAAITASGLISTVW
jgi:PIN domain nuclease of toxin-antitoxin system